MTADVRLVRAGARFTGVVTFDNLPGHAVGSLLCAVSPALLWPGRDVVSSVGGGKPLGWGAVDVDVTDLVAEDATSRYVDGAPAPGGGVGSFVESFRQACTPQGWADDSSWEALSAVLSFDRFDDSVVWYPPGNAHSQGEQDEGFNFWRRTSGFDAAGDLRPLPPATAPLAEQLLNVPPKKPGRNE